MRMAVVFLAIACLFLADLFVFGRVLLARDALADNIPMRVFQARVLQSGEFPFWCPLFGPGKPFFGDTTGSLYPSAFLYLFLKPAAALRVDWAVHIAIAGGSFYFLVRQFVVGRVAALTSAMAFMLSTWLQTRAEFLPALAACALVPLPVALMVRFLGRTPSSGEAWWRTLWPRRLDLALLTFVFAIAFLANYPEMLLYSLVAVGICLALAGRRALAGTAYVGVAGVFAVFLVLPQLVAILELLPFTERAGGVSPGVEMASFGVPHLLTLAFPFIAGRPGYPDALWASNTYEYWAIACYASAIAVWFVPYAIINVGNRDARQRMGVLIAGTMILTGFLMSAGSGTPVYGWLHSNVPGMDWFRFPSKFLVLSVVGILVLAAIGFQTLLDRDALSKKASGRVWVTWIVEGVVLGTITAFAVWISMDPERIGGLFNARPNVPASHFARAATDLRVDVAFHFVAVLLVGVLAGGGARFRRMAVTAIPVFVFINMTFVSRQLFATAPDDVADLDVPSVYASRLTDPNFRAASEFDAVQQLLYGEEDSSLFRWARDVGMGSMWISDGIHQVWQGSFKLSKYLALFRGPGDHDRSARDRLADMLAIRWMVAGAADPLDIFWGGGSRQARVIERTTALPRVRLVSEWDAWPADEEGAMARVIRQPPLSGSALVEPVALVDGRPTRRAVSPAMANQRPGTLHAVEFTANTIRAVADLDSTNLLVIADTWYPGWTAHVDGAPVEIFRVNGLFRGIFLPPGQHRVELRYRPRYWTSTILVSVIAAIVLGACVVSAIGRRSSRSAMPKHAAKPSFERGAARGAARFVGGCGTPR